MESLTEKEQDVVEAEDFIIYGKASIEQYDRDDPPQKIRMEAIEKALPQYFAQGGMISRRHKDVKVGEALKEYTLDEPTTLELADGDSISFDAGDTIKTEIKDDTLWLVANIYGEQDTEGSLLSKQTRLGAYHDQLDGFSVTVYTKEYTSKDEGQDVSEVDFFSVTIGDDELVKNKGSSFGVATFKQFLNADDAGTTAEAFRNSVEIHMSNRIFNHLFGKSKDGLAVKTIQTAQEEEVSLEEAASEVVDDDDTEPVVEAANEKLSTIEEKLEDLDEKQMDRQELAAEVADELGMSTGEVMEVFEQLDSNEMDEDDDDDDEDGNETPEEKEETQDGLTEKQQEEVKGVVEEALEEKGFVTEDTLQTKMDELGEKVDESLESIGEDVAEQISSKMSVNDTPDSSGGSDPEETNLDEQVDQLTQRFEV